MSRTLTLEVPDQVYEAVGRAAAASGLGAVDWVAAELCRRLGVGDGIRASRETAETADAQRGAWRRPRPRPQLTEREWEAARQRLLGFAGAVSSGDPRSADNERIDADLGCPLLCSGLPTRTPGLTVRSRVFGDLRSPTGRGRETCAQQASVRGAVARDGHPRRAPSRGNGPIRA